MELLDFINQHKNWRELLSNYPYFLKIVDDGPYTMLKYEPYASDMSNPICQQARGAIIRLNTEKTEYIPVSIALYKFFNSNEQYAAKIDWSTARVQEKVDGSLIKLAYDWVDGHWLLSTNGTIRAANAPVNDYFNFGGLFMATLNFNHDTTRDEVAFNTQKFLDFLAFLDKKYCYFFELVTWENRIVCRYDDDAIYYLGRRNMKTLKEDFSYVRFPVKFNIRYPAIYNLNSIEECLRAANELDENTEGFVVCDGVGNRIKIKTPWYLAYFHMRGQGVLNCRRVIEMWQQGIIDDYVGQFPEHEDFIDSVIDYIIDLAYRMISRWIEIYSPEKSRKEFAMEVKEEPPFIKAYLFARLDGKVDDPISYIKQMRAASLANFISDKLIITEVGVAADEPN